MSVDPRKRFGQRVPRRADELGEIRVVDVALHGTIVLRIGNIQQTLQRFEWYGGSLSQAEEEGEPVRAEALADGAYLLFYVVELVGGAQ